MAEKNIYIEGIDLLDFYGTANVNLEKLGAMMPKLKIIARGSTLKAIGTDDDIKHFESRVNALLDYYAKYGHISPDVIEQIFSKGIASPASLGDAIVYANHIFTYPWGQKCIRIYDPDKHLIEIGEIGR